MKKIYVLGLFLVLSMQVIAQNVFMVCNQAGTSCTPYNTVNDALNNAQNDDYIYLPGGTYVINVPVTKTVHIIGAGFNVDSSSVTEPTFLSGNLLISNTAEGSSFEGFYLSGNVTHTTASDTIKNCNFQRVWINGSFDANFNNIAVFQSVFNNYIFNRIPLSGINTGINNGHFTNCIMAEYVHHWYNATFSNNMFLRGAQIFHESANLIVRNCVFVHGGFGSGNSNMMVYNNLMFAGWGDGGPGMTINLNNITTSSCADNFDDCPTTAYQLTAEYKLKSTAPAKIAGSDGTDIGIYGGAMPWKLGSIPGNPHYTFKNIAPSTNANNNLPVNIKVKTGN